MTSAHGTPGFLVVFTVSAIAHLAGLLLGRARPSAWLFAPISFGATFLVAILMSNWLSSLLPASVSQSIAFPYLGLVFIALFSAFWGKAAAHIPTAKTHKRGALVSDLSAKLSSTLRKPTGLTLAGKSVPESDETKHFKMIGTTGTGKSTAIRELIGSSLDRGDRAVIADPDGSYLQNFYDASRGDQILNPFHTRATRWDLFGEITNLHDADQLARSLICDAEGNEGPWRNYARVFLASILRQLHRVKHRDVAELYQLISTTPVEDLRELLGDTPAGPYLSQDNGRFFGGVRSVASTQLAALEHIAQQVSRDTLSVRAWIREGRGVLFLPYNANEIATLRSIISTWMRLAIFETMGRGENPNHRLGVHPVWFVVDELDALGAIDGLKDALARLRKFGGRCVLGFQSIAQVSGTYGRAEAQTIVENCGNTLILRCSTSEGGGTARFASALIGEREIIREQITKSRRPNEVLSTKSISEQHVMESAVLASEIEQLPDLHGFLKLASQPEWKRVKLSLSVRG